MSPHLQAPPLNTVPAHSIYAYIHILFARDSLSLSLKLYPLKRTLKFNLQAVEVMAPSRPFPCSLKVVAPTVVFIVSLIFLPPKSVGSSSLFPGERENLQQRKLTLGSKPPACVDKCFNCRPCMATLVIPSHEIMKPFRTGSRGDDDGSYYLLSWKCKCGDKLFQP